MRKIFRVLVSRYTLSALFILAEIALIAYLAFYAYTYSFLFVLLANVVNLLVILSLINRDTNPEFKLTWLAVVVMIPLFGGVLYIMFYSRRLTRKEADFLKKLGADMLECERKNGNDTESLRVLNSLAKYSESGAGCALAVMKDDALAEIYSDCKTEYFSSGEIFFEAMLESLQGAKKYIFLEYFIVEDGFMWRSILEILREKIKSGVEVRMLYDDIGSMSTLPAGFDKKLRNEGISCYRFAKVRPKFSSSYNNRDHRKICVIDGKVAFTGGINIADEYINKKQRFGHWKDGGVRVFGTAAEGFARLFLVMFDFTCRKETDYGAYLSRESKANTGVSDDSHGGGEGKVPFGSGAEQGDKSGYLIPFGSGPAPLYTEPVGKGALMNIINASRRYLYITTPYLIIDYDITEALRQASKRGVDVRIITPGKADKKIVKIMTKSSYPYLIKAGVRIFEYTPGFIHEKLLVSDDIFAVVGTINFDYRSFVHHFEDALWICGDPVIADIRDSFMKTESVSAEILPSEAKLGFCERVIRTLIRIFAPLF
ncbi:MAG: PLDc N-terminal domain-containing protein [Clostridia bacterium]|nr:PLDc N-terminal domain-containing protein [Clostridia bacterium]